MISPAKAHAKVEHIQMFGITSHVSPTFFHLYATYYLESARASGRGENGFNPARYYLICRAIELCLKGFLSLKGYTMIRLSRGKLGHDLKSILDKAKMNGLLDAAPLSKAQLVNIAKASIYYHEKVFEYPAVAEAVRAYPKLPDSEMLLESAISLVRDLRAPCYT